MFILEANQGALLQDTPELINISENHLIRGIYELPDELLNSYAKTTKINDKLLTRSPSEISKQLDQNTKVLSLISEKDSNSNKFATISADIYPAQELTARLVERNNGVDDSTEINILKELIPDDTTFLCRGGAYVSPEIRGQGYYKEGSNAIEMYRNHLSKKFPNHKFACLSVTRIKTDQDPYTVTSETSGPFQKLHKNHHKSLLIFQDESGAIYPDQDTNEILGSYSSGSLKLLYLLLFSFMSGGQDYWKTAARGIRNSIDVCKQSETEYPNRLLSIGNEFSNQLKQIHENIQAYNSVLLTADKEHIAPKIQAIFRNSYNF